MLYTDPEIIAIMVLLPGIFGLALIAQGINDLKERNRGWFPLLTGLIFLIAIIFIYLYFNVIQEV